MNPVNPSFPPRPTTLVHDLLRLRIRTGDVVIDATAGNGHDTAFLAECVGETGKVLAFDVQESALSSARERVKAAGVEERVEFFLKSHSQMGSHAAAESIAAVMFNLGYLPGVDHDLTTQTDETLAALRMAANLLRPSGVLSIVCYPGHPTGSLEAEAVESWMSSLTADAWRVARYGAVGTLRPAPFLLIGVKASGPSS